MKGNYVHKMIIFFNILSLQVYAIKSLYIVPIYIYIYNYQYVLFIVYRYEPVKANELKVFAT